MVAALVPLAGGPVQARFVDSVAMVLVAGAYFFLPCYGSGYIKGKEVWILSRLPGL